MTSEMLTEYFEMFLSEYCLFWFGFTAYQPLKVI